MDLPAEILTEIGRYAVLTAEQPSSEIALRLMAVSKRWRDLFSPDSDSKIWTHVRLDTDSSQHMEDVATRALRMMVNARGAPQVVWVEGEDEMDLEEVYGALHGIGSTVQELRASLTQDMGFNVVWDALGREAPLLRILQIQAAPDNSPSDSLDLPPFPLTNLTHLALHRINPSSEESLLPLLNLLPKLTNLELVGCDNLPLVVPRLDGRNQIELSTLLSLVVTDHGGDYNYDFQQTIIFIAPLLHKLVIKNSPTVDYHNYLFPPAHPPNTAHLETLILEGSEAARRNHRFVILPVRRFHQDIPQMPVLKNLTILKAASDNDGSDPDEIYDFPLKLLEALTDSNPNLNAPPAPLLKTLALEANGQEGLNKHVVNLVRSRLGGPSGRTTRLREFECVDIGMAEETYDWLRTKLDVFKNKAFRRGGPARDAQQSPEPDL